MQANEVKTLHDYIGSLEDEVERLRRECDAYEGYRLDMEQERALADRLAEVLENHECIHVGLNPRLYTAEMKKRQNALAAYEETRK